MRTTASRYGTRSCRSAAAAAAAAIKSQWDKSVMDDSMRLARSATGRRRLYSVR